MKSFRIILITSYFILYTSYLLTAQIAINTDGTTPDASAMLDISSTDKGMLIPRMDSTSRTNISNPAIGLTVYDSTTTSFWYYDNDQWNEILDETQPLSLEDISENVSLPSSYACLYTVNSLNLNNSTDMVISGNYAYVLDLGVNKLKVIDISNPLKPKNVGNLTFSTIIHPLQIEISGNYAYVIGAVSQNLFVIDISNPSSPVLSSSLNLMINPSSIAISGNYVFITEEDDPAFKIIDITNPLIPQELSSSSLLNVTNNAAIAVSGNHAYVLDYYSPTNKQLLIIDISNLITPTVSNSIVIGSSPTAIALSGNYAYITDRGSDDLKVIDISNPSQPVLFNSLNLGNQPNDITIVGNYAFVTDAGSQDVKIIDISNPAAMTIITSFSLGAAPVAIEVVGNYAYIITSDEFKVINLPCDVHPTIDPITGDLTIDTTSLENHLAYQNITLNNYYLSNDGDDEGISISDTGTVTFHNTLLIGNNYISNDGDNEGIQLSAADKVTFYNNIALNGHYLSKDGDNEGLSLDDNGNVTMSNQLTSQGNILLNNNYLSNDGDDEGISIGTDGKTTIHNNMTIHENLTINNTLFGNQDTVFITTASNVLNDFIIENTKTGTDNYIATFKNTTNNNSVRNDGIKVVAGHNSFASSVNHLINFNTPDGTNIGGIVQNAASVKYNTTSDSRLKTNIQPTQYGISDILKIQVSDYFYKNDTSQTPQTGFIAQQLLQVFPIAVTIGGDNELTNPWTVDYASLTPLLVKGIQDQQQMLDNLILNNQQLTIQFQQLKKEQSKQQTTIQTTKQQLDKVQELEQQFSEIETLQQQSDEIKAMLEQIQTQLKE